jgi:hypothetical protein
MKMRVIVTSIAFLLVVSATQGQTKQSSWHTIRGVVVDKMGRPVAMATVCLKDLAGHRLRMKQTDRTGSFSFGLVNLETDREIYAEQGGSASRTVPIAGSGTRREIVVKLRLDATRQPAEAAK